MKFPFGYRSCSTVDAERASGSSFHPIIKSRKMGSLVHCDILNLQLLWIFCFLCFLDLRLGEISRPLNRAAVKGDKVQLNCSTQKSENGYWKYTKPFESYELSIYNGAKVVNGMATIFSVNDSVQGHFNLIFNASESTSGRYTCQPGINMGDRSAEVIVLDTAPNCSKIETSDFVNASCTIDFNGNWAPKIQWHSMNGRLETNDTTTVRNSRVTSFLIVPVNQTDFLTCAPTFVLENKPLETTATNVPDLLSNCTLIIGSPSDVSSMQPTTMPTTSTTTTTPCAALCIIGIVAMCVCVLAAPFMIAFIWKKRRKNSMDKLRPPEAEAMARSREIQFMTLAT